MEGAVFEVELSPDTGALLVPIGCAHAYEALEEDTIVCYVQDIPFNGEKTYAGINILSAGIIPQSPNPIMMPRDLEFPNLTDFESPFIYEG